jgi:hypothetical protein
MPKVFISYRRDDSQHQADRIHLALRKVIARRDIFIDIDNIPAGVDFVQHLDQKVSQCDVLLALIGPGWLNATSEGKRRLDDPKDFVRVEIASALRRGIPVAPVLLDGAPMPREADLPDDLKPLIRRNGTEVRRNSFDSDTKRLIEKLNFEGPGRGKLGWVLAAAMVVVVAAGVGGWWLLTQGGGAPIQTAAAPVKVAETPAAPVEAPVLPPPPVPEKSAAAAVAEPKPLESAAPPRQAPAPAACTGCPETSRQKLTSGAAITVSARITRAQWAAFCADYNCALDDEGVDPHLPMQSVSWIQVDQYVRWLSARGGRKYRLPTSGELDGLLGETPAASDTGVTEWTGTCHAGSGPNCQYEVRGWDAKGKRVFDWYEPVAKGKTLGFRVVADK